MTKQRVAIAIFILLFSGLFLLLHVIGRSTKDYEVAQLASIENEGGIVHKEFLDDLFEHKELNDSILEFCQPAPISFASELIIKKKAYIVSYNKDTKIPNWVAWHLTSEHTDGGYGRTNVFYEDENVPEPRATIDDYKGSGWSRGHMCPAGDNKWDEDAMYQSFSLINVCPQNASLNSGLWNSLEIDCRNWAKRFQDIYIVCGPVFYNKEHEVIGNNKVFVPEAFFKVILCLNGTPKGLGVVVKNNSGEKKRDLYYNSIDQIERITGIDFFPSLSDDLEIEIEKSLDLNMWK